MTHNVTLIPGDGIGPEVTNAARQIVDASGVKINWETVEAGEQVFKKGLATGIPKETFDSITKNKVALKGPLTTPIGYGEKSANVTLRKYFETYGNIRPVQEIPGVLTPYSGRGVDLVIVRENVEDLYAGIEYQQTSGTTQCLKLISALGCQRIVRLAFELALSQGRKTVHCAVKSNIMKITEGLLQRTFETMAKDYPEVDAKIIIVDNCAHQLVKAPEQFEIIVTTNMNGDILSDLSSALIGGLGFAPGANIGQDVAIFEAVHGSAPTYAGKDLINPTAVILSSVMMLRHLGEFDAARAIENAVYVTTSMDKMLTKDALPTGYCKTSEYTAKIISNLGKDFPNYKNRPYRPLNLNKRLPGNPSTKGCVTGIDVFVHSQEDPREQAQQITLPKELHLDSIVCRGVRLWPGNLKSHGADHFALRFLFNEKQTPSNARSIIGQLLNNMHHMEWMHLELLQEFDEKRGYSIAHGAE